MAQSKLAFLDSLDNDQLEYARKVAIKAKELGVPPALAISIAFKESSLRPDTPDSTDDAIGLMQVTPKTGRGMGYSEKDLRDTDKNIEAGLKYIKEGLNATGNDYKLAAAYYHSGPDIVASLAAGEKLGPRTKEYLQALKGFGTFNVGEGQPAESSESTPESEADVSAKNVMAANKDPASVDYFGKYPASMPADKVEVKDPTDAQLYQMKLDKEMADAREAAQDEKKMMAGYGGAAGLALGSPAQVKVEGGKAMTKIGGMVDRLAAQMPPQGAPMASTGAPMGGGAPTPAPTGGLPSGVDAQTERILQGTTGDQGTTGRARQTGYNVETSQQAAAKARAQSIIDSLRQTGQVVDDAPTFFSQQPGMTSTPSGVLAPRSSPAPTLGPRGPAGEIGGARPTPPVVPRMSGLDATKDLFVSMMKSAGNVGPSIEELKDLASRTSRFAGRLPIVSAPLAGLNLGYEAPEFFHGMGVSQPDYTDLALTGLGMAGTVGSFFPPAAPLAAPLSIIAPTVRDIRRQKQEIERNPAEYRDVIMKSLSNTDPMGNPIP